jgi:hypothetical protein
VINRRIMVNLHGYEQSQEFLREIDVTYKVFSRGLSEATERQSYYFRMRTPGIVKYEAVDALKENSVEFQKFYSSILSDDPALGDVKSSTEILEAMLAFSTLVYMESPDRWAAAKKGSHFWPVCKAIGRVRVEG